MLATISRDELKAKIDRGDHFRLVETLPEPDFVEAHLPGAIHLPPDRVRELAPEVLPDKNEDIVVYCASPTCQASEKAARELIALGYTHVRDYQSGKQDWMDAGLPVASAWNEPTPAP
jgi:rhodanese-related sulfurtransferase